MLGMLAYNTLYMHVRIYSIFLKFKQEWLQNRTKYNKYKYVYINYWVLISFLKK